MRSSTRPQRRGRQRRCRLSSNRTLSLQIVNLSRSMAAPAKETALAERILVQWLTLLVNTRRQERESG